MKKILALLLVVILTATVSISGTLAFVQASAAGVDVQTDGNKVDIDQQIYYRHYESSDSATTCTLKQREGTKDSNGVTIHGALDLYPAVYAGTEPNSSNYTDSQNAVVSNQNLYNAPNILDEIVVVKNVGSNNAYVRTWIAVECGSITNTTDFERIVTLKYDKNGDSNQWSWESADIQQLDGKNYYILLATYKKVLEQNNTTPPSLLQVMLKNTAGNADCAALDGNGNGKLDIRIFSQAALPQEDDTIKDVSTVENIKAMLNACFKTTPPEKWVPTTP